MSDFALAHAAWERAMAAHLAEPWSFEKWLAEQRCWAELRRVAG